MYLALMNSLSSEPTVRIMATEMMYMVFSKKLDDQERVNLNIQLKRPVKIPAANPINISIKIMPA